MVERKILDASFKKTRLPDVWTLHVRNDVGRNVHAVFALPFSKEELDGFKTRLNVKTRDEIAGKFIGGLFRIQSENNAIVTADGTEFRIDEETRKAGSTFAHLEPAESFRDFDEEKQFRKFNPLKCASNWATAHQEADEAIRDIIKRLNDTAFAYTSGWSHSFLEEKQQTKFKTPAERFEERRKNKEFGASKPWDPRLIHWPCAAVPMQEAFLTFRANSEDPKTAKLFEALKRLKIRTEKIPASQATFKGQPNFLIRFRVGHKDLTKRNEAVRNFWNKVRQAIDECA